MNIEYLDVNHIGLKSSFVVQIRRTRSNEDVGLFFAVVSIASIRERNSKEKTSLLYDREHMYTFYTITCVRIGLDELYSIASGGFFIDFSCIRQTIFRILYISDREKAPTVCIWIRSELYNDELVARLNILCTHRF